MPEPTEHYFSETTATPFKPREIEVELAGDPYKVTTAAGVFSPDSLDRGTQVLLNSLESAPDGDILDIGCGWGAISLHTALENPASTVWAVDINDRARELAAMNANRLNLQNITVSTPAEIPADITFTEIRSNPPIRIGKTALHELLKMWLPRLAIGGSAYLVVAKHLGAESLAKWIAETWPEFEVTRYARSKGFHVLRVLNG